MVDKSQIAIYVTADKKFFPYAIVTLTSFMKYYPECSYFILTDSISYSEENRKALEAYKISLQWTEMHKSLTDTSSMAWPSIVYLMLAGPEYFFNLGYQYSLGLDADVLCMKRFELVEIFKQTQTFAGIANQDNIISNIKQKWREQFSIQSGIAKKNAEKLFNPNTGVMFWNNEWAMQEKLFEKCLDAYIEYKNFLVLSDQGLLATVILLNEYSYHHLPHKFNFRLGNKNDVNLGFKPINISIVHFTGIKPWNKSKFLNKKVTPLKLNIRKNFFLYWQSVNIFAHSAKKWRCFSAEVLNTPVFGRFE